MLLAPQFWPFSHNSEIPDCPCGRGGFSPRCGPQHDGGLGSAGGCWGAWWWPRLPHHSTSPVIYEVWFAAVTYLWYVNKLEWASGRGWEGDRGMLEKKVSCLPLLWGAEGVICHWSSVISASPGQGGRKTANWWQPWNKHLRSLRVILTTCR